MDEKKYLKLNDIESYKIAFNLSNYIWDIVLKWEYFAKKTIGAQFVNSANSISANIAEGFGRYSKRIKLDFTELHLDQCMKHLTGTKKLSKGNLFQTIHF